MQAGLVTRFRVQGLGIGGSSVLFCSRNPGLTLHARAETEMWLS